MQTHKNYQELKKISQDSGADLFGVADISGIRGEFLLSGKIIKKFDKAICLGTQLSRPVLEEIELAPTRLYFHHYRTLNNFLDQLALKVASYIQKKGFWALAIPASQILDWEEQKAHLSHKSIGRLSGLGWIGRNNLLVSPSLGSQFRLVSILTDMPLEADKPLKRDCGECRLCVSVCPAGAIGDDPQSFDHQRCFAKLKEFQKQHLVSQYICGVCVKACKPRI